jgi:hypothetical protein
VTQQLIHQIGTAAVCVGALAAVLFVVGYHLSAYWWRSEEGWHLEVFTASLAAILGYSSYRNLTGTAVRATPDLEISRTVVFTVVAALLVWRCWMLYRIQIRPIRRRPADRDGGEGS